MADKGVFITFEGGEGTGKSTQVKLLAEALNAAGIEVVTTREPGGTPQAEKIRGLLVQRDAGDLDPVTEVLLLNAARREHLVQKIWPAMEAGKWVVSDRFADSTRAMQGRGMGVADAVIESVYQSVAGDFKPDLTFVFDIDPAVGLARSTKRLAVADAGAKTEDRYERMSLAFHTRLREGFLEVAKREPERCVIVDAAQGIETIHAQVTDTVSKKFGLKLAGAAHGRAV
jgi:dTMP kinase